MLPMQWLSSAPVHTSSTTLSFKQLPFTKAAQSPIHWCSSEEWEIEDSNFSGSTGISMLLLTAFTGNAMHLFKVLLDAHSFFFLQNHNNYWKAVQEINKVCPVQHSSPSHSRTHPQEPHISVPKSWVYYSESCMTWEWHLQQGSYLKTIAVSNRCQLHAVIFRLPTKHMLMNTAGFYSSSICQ